VELVVVDARLGRAERGLPVLVALRHVLGSEPVLDSGDREAIMIVSASMIVIIAMPSSSRPNRVIAVS